MCVLMCVPLYDFDKDVQHKTIWVTLSTCLRTRSIQRIHKNMKISIPRSYVMYVL